MIQLYSVYLLLVVFIIFLMKIIDCGQLIIKQRVSFNPVLNSIYYIIGIFCILTMVTMFNERGLIYHQLMPVILLGITAFIFIPSVFVKPTINTIIATVISSIIAVVSGALVFFAIADPQNGTFIALAVYLITFFIPGVVLLNVLDRKNEKGTKILFYKQKLWELLNDRRLLIPVFALVSLEFALQFYGYTILFFLPI